MPGPEVTAVTANRGSINEREYVRLTVLHTANESAAYDCDLVVNRTRTNGESTLYRDSIITGPEETQTTVTVQLQETGRAELCAFLTNCEFIRTLPEDT